MRNATGHHIYTLLTLVACRNAQMAAARGTLVVVSTAELHTLSRKQYRLGCRGLLLVIHRVWARPELSLLSIGSTLADWWLAEFVRAQDRSLSRLLQRPCYMPAHSFSSTLVASPLRIVGSAFQTDTSRFSSLREISTLINTITTFFTRIDCCLDHVAGSSVQQSD